MHSTAGVRWRKKELSELGERSTEIIQSGKKGKKRNDEKKMTEDTNMYIMESRRRRKEKIFE